MRSQTNLLAAALASAVLAAGCAGDGSLDLTTASVSPPPAAAPKVDPVCVSLAAQMDQLRQEGTLSRLEQASSGKSASVTVKRASLTKVGELNRVTAEFQSRCSTITPKPTAALAPAATATATSSTTVATTNVQPAGTVAASGVTAAKPAVVASQPKQ